MYFPGFNVIGTLIVPLLFVIYSNELIKLSLESNIFNWTILLDKILLFEYKLIVNLSPLFNNTFFPFIFVLFLTINSNLEDIGL